MFSFEGLCIWKILFETLEKHNINIFLRLSERLTERIFTVLGIVQPQKRWVDNWYQTNSLALLYNRRCFMNTEFIHVG